MRRGKIAVLLAGCLVGAAGVAGLAWHWPGAAPADAFRRDRFVQAQQAALERITALADKAATFDPQKALGDIGTHPIDGVFAYLEDRTPVVEPAAAMDGVTDEAAGVLFACALADTAEAPASCQLHPHRGVLTDGGLSFQFEEGTYLSTTVPLEIATGDLGEFELRLRVTQGTNLELRASTGAGLTWEDATPLFDVREGQRRQHRRISIPLIADGRFHTYRINANRLFVRTQEAVWRARHAPPAIRQVLLQPSDVPGDEVTISTFRLRSRRAQYARATHGTIHEYVGSEMRRALYVNTPLSLHYDLRLPAEPSALHVGIAPLLEEAPVQYSVSARCAQAAIAPATGTVEDNENWRDTTVDLSPCAGQPTRITLAAQSQRGNVAFFSNPTVVTRPQRRLNVIVVVEDALRADHMSCYGYAKETTPFKDQWAGEGALFTYAVSQAPSTRPSIPSLMTSLLPSATGVWTFADVLDQRYVTLAEVMRRQGFVTASFLQNHHAGSYAGLHQGFGILRSVRGPTTEMYSAGLHHFLRQHRERNLFLYLHILDPHGPYDPPAPYDAPYRQWEEGAGPQEKTPVAWVHSLDPAWSKAPTREGRRLLYDGEIRHNDEQFRQLIQWLKDLGLYEDTVLFLIGDHGEFLGERGLWEHRPPGYIQVLRVPLLIIAPGKLPAGVRIDAPVVQLMDIMPTILDLAGIDPSPLLLHGDSLLPLIRGERQHAWAQRIAFSEEGTGRERAGQRHHGSLFFERWHFLQGTGLPLEIFDLVDDPQEERPLAHAAFSRRIAEDVAQFIDAYQVQAAKIRRALQSDSAKPLRIDPDVVKRLRALGYLN